MNRTNVTYGHLDKLLRSLGFSYWLSKQELPARVYEHKESGALLTLPPFPMDDFVFDHHLVAARTTVDLFGVADRKVFDAKLEKVAG